MEFRILVPFLTAWRVAVNRHNSVKHQNKRMMESKNYFGNYTLAQTTLDKLREIKDLLERDSCPERVAWNIIKPKREGKDPNEDAKPAIIVACPEFPENKVDESESVPESSTQFFFSQRERNAPTPTIIEVSASKWMDIAELLRESLESTNEALPLVNLKNLSEQEANDVIKYLSEKLTLKGTYNLCHSTCAVNAEQSMSYIRMICSNLLLQKIIDLDEPSRLISIVIHELVEKFPDDVQEFIYTPMLNEELRDTSVFSAIINSYPPQRKHDLNLIFLSTVHELKKWHVSILSQLINGKIADNCMRDKLLDLLMEKASIYSDDTNYGKFLLSFLKLNAPFTENQKGKLSEIVAINETIFKKVMNNLLSNMYLHGNLWHIT